MQADQLNSYVSVSCGFCNGIRDQLAGPNHILVGQPQRVKRVHQSLDAYQAGRIGPADLLGNLSRVSVGNMVSEWRRNVSGLRSQRLYGHSPEIENLGEWPQHFPNVDPHRPGWLGTRLWRPLYFDSADEFKQNFHALDLLFNLGSLPKYLKIRQPGGLISAHYRKPDGSPLSAKEIEAWENFIRSGSRVSDADMARYNIKLYKHYDLLDLMMMLGINLELRGENALRVRLATFEPNQESPEASTETDLTSQDCVRDFQLDDTRIVELSFKKRENLKLHKQSRLHPAILTIHDVFHVVSQGKQSEELKAFKVRMDELAQQAAGLTNPWLASARVSIWDSPMVTAEECPVPLGFAGARILRDIGFSAWDASADFYDEHHKSAIKPEYREAWYRFKRAFFDLIRQEFARTNFYRMFPHAQKPHEDPSIEGGFAALDYVESTLGYAR